MAGKILLKKEERKEGKTLPFNMLSFKNRVKKRKDFEKILKGGKLINSEIATVKFFKNNLDQARFGFIVSRKVSLRAVKRNRVKRILREQIRLLLPRFKENLDIIIIARKEIVEKNSKEIGFILESLFIKNGILSPK